MALSFAAISAAIAQMPFLIASNRYIEIAHEFVESYNSRNPARSLLLIDYSGAPGRERDAYRLSHLRRAVTNICCVTPEGIPQLGSTNVHTWIQVGKPRLSPDHPEYTQRFAYRANGARSGYLEMRFPLLSGIAPTQANSIVIGLTNPDRDIYDTIININIDSDR